MRQLTGPDVDPGPLAGHAPAEPVRRHRAPDVADAETDAEELRAYLYDLSGGRVVDVRPSGPVFGPLPPRRTAVPGMLHRRLPRGSARTIAWLTAGWVVTFAGFVVWWLLPAHRISMLGFVVNSVLLLAILSLSIYFLQAVNRMRSLEAGITPPRLRVAMIVTKAPSEPWPLVRTTLEAMLAQHYLGDHDIWLADEDPSDETVAWCTARGVFISTRKHDSRYQRTTWPRRRRCKEGNLAYFYDHYGYENYDVVSQLDSDHVPDRGYLREIVRHFADPAVGYVAAPSVCDANADVSWTVRGRPHDEAMFHGAQQLGFNGDGTPVCIGSHYAVRTAALRQIGGLGPDLAEDFTTSYLLNVAGWRGAFAIDAAARGDGPPDFAAMVTQEFQWAHSLTTVFFGLVLRTCRVLPRRLAAQFVFQSGFDMLLALMSVGGLSLFAVACATGSPWVSVHFVVFFGLWFALAGWMLLVSVVVRRGGLMRPADAPIVSWERGLYAASRWPFLLLGVVVAMVERVVPRTVDFKVTPKGSSGPQVFPVRLVLPFCVTALVLTACAAAGLDSPPVVGYVGLSLLTASGQTAVATLVTVLHARDTRRRTAVSVAAAARLVRAPLLVCAVSAVPVAVVAFVYLSHLVKVL
ncbi:glycosyltransferase family 2 protein [Rhodococcus sp. NPDC003318]|uniref:glycosyltransferase family 2 protein n=1 Tax=Rhodococcus sp. NPDC003318 TaxID=3364503 RepID=UPI0036A65A8D